MGARGKIFRFAVAAVAAATVAAAPAALARPDRGQTTEPENFVIYTVKIASGAVTFDPEATIPRGYTAEFKIYNQTKYALRFTLGGRTSKVMKPKAHTIFFLIMVDRGTYTWRAYGPKAPTLKGTFEVT